MSRFYVTLPSNSSMDYYPENTVACYTTKLANTVELEGDWEVGLAEMSIPSAVYSVIVDKCYYIVSMDNKHFPSIVVPQGHYKRVSDLIKVKVLDASRWCRKPICHVHIKVRLY